MQIGVVQSFNSGFFSFKENKILIKLTNPVYQIVLRESALTCTSKKVELQLSNDLTGMETLVMGRKFEYDEFKRNFLDLKSSFWISAAVDSTDMQKKLNGIAETCGGKVVFLEEFGSVAEAFSQLERYAGQQLGKNKSIIHEYCEKNIELLNRQIRLLTQDKNMYTELLNIV